MVGPVAAVERFFELLHMAAEVVYQFPEFRDFPSQVLQFFAAGMRWASVAALHRLVQFALEVLGAFVESAGLVAKSCLLEILSRGVEMMNAALDLFRARKRVVRSFSFGVSFPGFGSFPASFPLVGFPHRFGTARATAFGGFPARFVFLFPFSFPVPRLRSGAVSFALLFVCCRGEAGEKERSERDGDGG